MKKQRINDVSCTRIDREKQGVETIGNLGLNWVFHRCKTQKAEQ